MDLKYLKQMIPRVLIIVCLCVTLIAFFISCLQLINYEISEKKLKTIYNDEDEKIFEKRKSIIENNNLTKLNSKFENIFWFLQITDIHLSVHFDQKRKPDLLRFCTENIDTIKPEVTVVTGDITDARTRNFIGSTQYEQEWIWYEEVLKQSNVTEKTKWIDLRGNHDAFNVYSWDSTNNYYRKYTHEGGKHSSHFKYDHKRNGTNGNEEIYTFIMVDACLDPSPKRPFNFIGYLDKSDIDELKEMALTSMKNGSNALFWFGHYPTSSIAMPKDIGLPEMIRGPYMCGHFHNLMGMINHMYASHSSSALEIELSDFKDNRMYRLAAYDNGLFMFKDVKLGKWPVILITNPKAALYLMPNIESANLIAHSTHIRVLVFSTSNIKSVMYRINNEQWQEMYLSEPDKPLYIAEWKPANYANGLHTISVEAVDTAGNHETVKHEFSLDGHKPKFTLGGRLALRVGIVPLFKSLFFSIVLINIVPLIFLRVWHWRTKGNTNIKMKARSSFLGRLVFRFYLLSMVDIYFYPLILIPLYATFGPLFVGEIIDGHRGICFIWGMYVGKNNLPVGFTYFFTSIFLLLLHLTLTCTFAQMVYCRYVQLCSKRVRRTSDIFNCRNIICLVCLAFSFFFCWLFFYAYGILTVIFGFFFTWSTLIYFYLSLMTFRLTKENFNRMRSLNSFDKISDQQQQCENKKSDDALPIIEAKSGKD